VNVLDFVKIVNIVGLDAQTATRLCSAAARIARAESLTAHAAAATARETSSQSKSGGII
jgi:histidinol dehydrogenase